MSFDKLTAVLKGGAGSGNFGHAGRVGKIGGSIAMGADKGGAGSYTFSGHITGPADVVNAVSQPTHPMYRAYMHGNTSFESEDSARVNFGSGKTQGQYLLTREGDKFQVNGWPKGTKKKLLKKFNSVPEALEAMEEHWSGMTVKRMEWGSPEWYKKYPETRTTQDVKITGFGRKKRIG